ncbi:MAG: hypothetical protein MI923_11215, partial [Phycisphaerales bacterium]|nr:hypothetical protein [Phycisphaerales bacterium]
MTWKKTRAAIVFSLLIMGHGLVRSAIASTNVSIVAGGANTGVAIADNGVTVTYTPTNSGAQIGADHIVANLNANKNVVVDTTAAADQSERGDITVAAAIVKTSVNGADLKLTAPGAIAVNAGVTNVGDGDITLVANATATTSGNFIGIIVSSGNTVEVTGTGDIALTGFGGDDAGGTQRGVRIEGTVRSTAGGADAGTITITGTGRGGGWINYGVDITGFVTSVDGAINIVGQGGGDGAGALNNGVLVQREVRSTGTGPNAATITINGAGGVGFNSDYGVAIDTAAGLVTSVDGDIAMTGQGGSGNGSFKIGVIITRQSRVTSTGTGPRAADITIDGVGGTLNTNNNNNGVEFDGDGFGSGTSIESVDGAITVTGTAGNGNSDGIIIEDSATGVLSTGAGDIHLTGIAGNGDGIDMRVGAIGGATATGNVKLEIDQLNLTGGTVETGGTITVESHTNGASIGLGGADGTLNLTDDEIARLNAGSGVVVGDTAAGPISIDTATFSNALTLISAGEIHDANDGGTDLTAPTITFHGTVAPGSTAVGDFNLNGNATLAASSVFDVDLTGSTSGGAHDRMTVTGNTTLEAGAALNLDTTAYGPHEIDLAITIVADTVTNGVFNGLPNGATTDPRVNSFEISYGSVVLTAVIAPCDSDGDGVCDDTDPCPQDNPDDSDGDSVCDSVDVCPGFDDRADADGDGVPDGCDVCVGDDTSGDTDGDGVCDDTDPCPQNNPDDSDGDSVCDSADVCPGFDDRADADGDGVPDGCDVCVGDDVSGDTDGDGVC